jgi:hypothetical protein
MPRKSLAEVQAHKTEKIRLRTERRIAQLRRTVGLGLGLGVRA